VFWRKRRIRIDSGELAFQVTIPGEDRPKTWKTDLITMRLAAQDLEERFRLKVKQGIIYGTAEFFEALAAKYVELGAPACDPSQARAVWIAVNNRFNRVESQLAREIDKLK
jgi:hypothetical protein